MKTRKKECHEVPRLPRKITLQPALTPLKRRGFAGLCCFPHRHGEATGKPETRDETRGSIKTSISCETILTLCSFKIDVFLRVSLEPTKLLPQNRCFVRGCRQFNISQNAMPATQFAPCRHLTQPRQCDSRKKRQHDTPKVLRLPRDMTMEVAKVLHLPRKLDYF